MSNFTPGPWQVYKIPGDSRPLVITSDKRVVCEVTGLQSNQVLDANARLIGAAPAMLEAMNALYKTLLLVITEANSELEPIAHCPVCYFTEAGSFHSASEDMHHDRCPWPAFLKARSLAQDS